MPSRSQETRSRWHGRRGVGPTREVEEGGEGVETNEGGGVDKFLKINKQGGWKYMYE